MPRRLKSPFIETTHCGDAVRRSNWVGAWDQRECSVLIGPLRRVRPLPQRSSFLRRARIVFSDYVIEWCMWRVLFLMLHEEMEEWLFEPIIGTNLGAR